MKRVDHQLSESNFYLAYATEPYARTDPSAKTTRSGPPITFSRGQKLLGNSMFSNSYSSTKKITIYLTNPLGNGLSDLSLEQVTSFAFNRTGSRRPIGLNRDKNWE